MKRLHRIRRGRREVGVFRNVRIWRASLFPDRETQTLMDAYVYKFKMHADEIFWNIDKWSTLYNVAPWLTIVLPEKYPIACRIEMERRNGAKLLFFEYGSLNDEYFTYKDHVTMLLVPNLENLSTLSASCPAVFAAPREAIRDRATDAWIYFSAPLDPDWVEDAWRKGISVYKNNPALSRLASLDPSSTTRYQAQMNAGFHAFKLDIFPAARLFFRTAIKEDPNSSEAWTQLGMTCHQMSQHDEAEAAFIKAMELAPDSSDPIMARYLEYLSNQQVDKVRELGFYCLEKFPLIMDVLRRVSKNEAVDMDVEIHRFVEAYGHKRVFDIGPLGLAYLASGTDTINEFIDVEACNLVQAGLMPYNYVIWWELGKLLLARKEYATCVRCLTEALRLNPSDTDTLSLMGQAHCRLDQFEEAFDYLTRAFYCSTIEGYEVFNPLGELYLRLGQLDNAIRAFRHVLSIFPNDKTANYQLTMAYIASGDFDAAHALHTAIINIDRTLADVVARLIAEHTDHSTMQGKECD
ncbi:MAG: tetratricopeptide repeat protein [Verrucomicrobiae bacterium]|nr:tetratricopeptide repeat protein [Verrucomicrobiae bacterium]